MIRPLVAALLAAALLGCGSEEVQFDIDSPPKWLTSLDQSLPAKALRPDEISGDCFGRQFRECTATVAASRAMTRKGKFGIVQGQEVRITYAPNEEASDVTITLRAGKDATVPVRKSGGTLTFRCLNPFESCVMTPR